MQRRRRRTHRHRDRAPAGGHTRTTWARRMQDQIVAIEKRVTGDPVIFQLGGIPWLSVGWNSAGLSLTGNELSPNDERVGISRVPPGARDDARPNPGRDGGDGAATRPRLQLQQRAHERRRRRRQRRGQRHRRRGHRAWTARATSRTRTTTCAIGCCRSRATPTTRSARRFASSERGPCSPSSRPPRSPRTPLRNDPVRPRGRTRLDLPPSRARRRRGAAKTVFWCVADVTDGRITFGRGNPCDSVGAGLRVLAVRGLIGRGQRPRRAIVAGSPRSVARSNAVRPSSFTNAGSAPASSRSVTIAALPLWAAACNGVQPPD